MKKVMFLVSIMALFLASCGNNSSNSEVKVTEIVLPLTVDYRKSTNLLLKEGEYLSIDEFMPKTFSIYGDTKDTVISHKAILVNFGRIMPMQDVYDQLKIRGLRPGTATELFTLGVRYSGFRFQKEISIVAFGSPIPEDPMVPCLSKDMAGNQDAHLEYWDKDWDPIYWFLAFRDSTL